MAFRSLLKRGRHNLMKILSLAIGLALGLVLIAKVYMEQSYDDFVPDADRTYQIWELYDQNGELKDFPHVSGGVAIGMKREIPQVEKATRYTLVLSDANFTVQESRKRYRVKQATMADTCFFDIFPRRILAGDAKTVLATPKQVLVNASLAKRIGGEVLGKQIMPDDWPGCVWTIGGIFEDLPENSTWKDIDMLISMPTYQQMMMPYDGTMNWLGNDRYCGYVRFLPGVHPDALKADIRAMQARNQDMEALQKAGVGLEYTLHSLKTLHKELPEVKRAIWLLSLLAFALILTAVMNYVLIVVSSIINRSKEVAVYKCFGASSRNIHGMVFSEALLHVLIALVLAVLLIYCFRGTVEELLDASLQALFLSKGVAWLVAICAFVLLVTGLVPGYLYARIPVASVFRRYRESKRLWKLGLLCVQFMAAGFLVTLLAVIGKQYHRMTNDNPGYDCTDIAFCPLQGTDSTARRKAIDEVLRLPEVQSATSCYQLLFDGCSGNNVRLPDDDRDLFNIADLYSCGDGYLELMGIPVVEGRSFTEEGSHSTEVMVSRSFVEKMRKFADWSDGAVGKQIYVSEHSSRKGTAAKPILFTICGVYEDFRIGSIADTDRRPSVLFYSSDPSSNLLIRFHQLTTDAMHKAYEAIRQTFPDREVMLMSYRSELNNQYADARKFRDAVMYGGAVTLLIALIGLIGYTNDEVNRRRKEMAIRKVNGARAGEVILMFLRDVFRIALPAVLVGCLLAYRVAGRWLEQFSEKASLPWYLFAGCGLAVAAVILLTVAFDSEKAARENPVDSLKSE